MAAEWINIIETLGLTTSQLAALIILYIWSLIWKAIALWKSARKKQLIWFIILLVANTAGILEILYIFLFSKIKLEEKSGKKKKNKL